MTLYQACKNKIPFKELFRIELSRFFYHCLEKTTGEKVELVKINEYLKPQIYNILLRENEFVIKDHHPLLPVNKM